MKKDDTGRDAALIHLEKMRKTYIGHARKIALDIALAGNGRCTVDDIRARFPPPANCDGRMMGAIFNHRDWVHVGFVRFRRKACHGRPISVFCHVSKVKRRRKNH